MPLTHEPKPLPSELDYRPENSEEYLVKTGDSFLHLQEAATAQVLVLNLVQLAINRLPATTIKTAKLTLLFSDQVPQISL
jgi:hypothetical protein